MSFFNELKRRNVLRVGVAYVVMAWLIIQVAETIFPLFGFGDVPARVVVIVLAVGFFPVLVSAWALEWTPQGLKLDSDVRSDSGITPGTGKKLDRIILVVLAVALGFFSFDKFVLDPQRDAELVKKTAQQARSETLTEEFGDNSIIVLPFADLSAAGDQEYFSDGIAEELLNLLAKIPELRVVSRSTSFSYKGTDIKVGDLAEQLDVAHVLEGSVRRSGDQLRITAQLIDARTDTHLWSETYDRKFENIFAIQDEIAEKVVSELKLNILGDTPRVRKTDPEAYDLILQAGFLMQRLDPDEIDTIVDLLEQAVAIDPDSFQAWFKLGGAYQRKASYDAASKEVALEKSWQATRRAAEIEPESISLLYRMGWMAMRWDEDLELAAVYIQRAVDLTEDPIRKVARAQDLLRRLGRYELIIKLGEHVVREHPTEAKQHLGLARAYSSDGQYKNAIRYFRSALTLSPGMIRANGDLAYTLLMDGQYEAVLEAAAKEKNPETRFSIKVMALDALGRPEEAQLVFEELQQLEDVDSYWLAEIYTRRDEKDKAFDALESLSLEDGEVDWKILEDPAFNRLHGDPRWQNLVDKIGQVSVKPDHIILNVPTPEAWREAGE